MKKVHRYWLSPNHESLCMSLTYDSMPCGTIARMLCPPFTVWDSLQISDVTTHDLELHAFLRVSHQFLVQPDCLAGEKIEEMFELENPNI